MTSAKMWMSPPWTSTPWSSAAASHGVPVQPGAFVVMVALADRPIGEATSPRPSHAHSASLHSVCDAHDLHTLTLMSEMARAPGAMCPSMAARHLSRN